MAFLVKIKERFNVYSDNGLGNLNGKKPEKSKKILIREN